MYVQSIFAFFAFVLGCVGNVKVYKLKGDCARQFIQFNSPCVPPTGEAYGSADQSTKKPILVSLVLFNHPLKALMLGASTTRWSSWLHPLITLFENKYLQQSRVHRNLTSFLECPPIPLVLSARVKNTFNFNLDNPLHVLKTSIISWLFLWYRKQFIPVSTPLRWQHNEIHRSVINGEFWGIMPKTLLYKCRYSVICLNFVFGEVQRWSSRQAGTVLSYAHVSLKACSYFSFVLALFCPVFIWDIHYTSILDSTFSLNSTLQLLPLPFPAITYIHAPV